jgi:membrane-associated phospholipid phosphatase
MIRGSTPRASLAGGLLAGLVLAAPAAPVLRAQDSATVRASHAIRWWHGAAVLGGIATATALDAPLQRYIQGHRSPSADRVASVVRRGGQPEVFATVPAALLLTGLVTHRSGLTRASARIAASLALAGAVSTTGKFVFGRPRPSDGGDPDDWKAFSHHQSMPSGHTTMAFALATSLANEIHRPWASAGLLTLAAGTGWSRLNDNRHWLSDVLAGAAVGITSAELVDGRWRVFHLRPPALFIGPAGTGLAVGWSGRF